MKKYKTDTEDEKKVSKLKQAAIQQSLPPLAEALNPNKLLENADVACQHSLLESGDLHLRLHSRHCQV